MKDYTYKERELDFIRHIKSVPPKKIWWGFSTYIFDYGDFYYQLECVPKIANSQNKSDEAIIGQLTKYPGKYTPEKHSKLVCENKLIQELYVVRGFLYFTTFETYSEIKVLLKKAKLKVKELLSGKPDPVGEILADSIGGYQEIICHPKSKQVEGINLKYSNVIDVGLLIQIDGKCLKAFVENNGFGFQIWNDKYFCDIEELKEASTMYEFIKV